MAPSNRPPPPSPPHRFPSEGYEAVTYSRLIDEEQFSWYDPKDFYGVRIGEVIKSRYQVVGKLGFGSASTAWLCRDLRGHCYVTLKVYANNQRQADREVDVLNHIMGIQTRHAGSRFIRKMRDHFEIARNDRKYVCLVHDPLGVSFRDLQETSPSGRFPPTMVKALVKYLLYALDFLHSEARVVHTDIQAGNIMLSVVDEDQLRDFEDMERSDPSARKIDGDRIVYKSRGFSVASRTGPGGNLPILCDFGEAAFGEECYTYEAMPDLYRAPEILLKLPWGDKIDIWSFGLMIWGIVEGKSLFTERLPSREESRLAHMARIISLLGPPPEDLLESSDCADKFFDEKGGLKGGTKAMPSSFEEEEEALSGTEKEGFLRFLRKMLQWRPKDRMSARQLMSDPWLELKLDRAAS